MWVSTATRFPARDRQLGKRPHRVVKLRDAVGAHQPELPEGPVVDRIGAGDGSGMGERGRRPQFAAAAFQDHHRLRQGDFAGGFEKAARIGEAFQIDCDDPRGLVVLEEGEQLGHLHIGHVADGDVFVQAQAAGGAGRNQERVAEGAALGEDAHSAARVGWDVEVGVEPAHGVHDAKAIRADEAYGRGTQDRDQILLPLRRLGGVELAEARRHAHHGRDVVEAAFSLGQLFRDRHGQLGRNQQHAKLDRFGDVAHALVARQPEDRLLARIDRI